MNDWPVWILYFLVLALWTVTEHQDGRIERLEQEIEKLKGCNADALDDFFAR